MLTRTQLMLLTAMLTLGGSFAGFLAVGIAMGDITLALINLGVIVALFAIAFVIGSGSGEKPAKKLLDTDSFPSVTYYSVDFPHEFAFTGSPSEEAIKYFQEQAYENNRKRAGDLHVGGEVLPEFK